MLHVDYTIKKYKYALLIASYSRVDLLIKQIYCMLNQSYQNTCVFVAVKGLSEIIVQDVILPQFEREIDAGKLVLRMFPNSNQLHNLMDCIRDLDIPSFDYFVKIDDDDLYSYKYVETLNAFHSNLPYDTSSHLSAYVPSITSIYRSDVLLSACVHLGGAMHCMSKKAFEAIREYDAPESESGEKFKLALQELAINDLTCAEDHLYLHVMQKFNCVNIQPFLDEHNVHAHFVLRRLPVSITRSDTYCSKHFMACNSGLTFKEEYMEHTVQATSVLGSFVIRIVGDLAFTLQDIEGTVKAFTDDILIIEWEIPSTGGVRVDHYTKNEFNEYKLHE